MPGWPDRVRLTGIAAARRRIVDPAHAAGIIAVPIVTVLAGILGKPGVNFLGRHAGIGGIEQRPLGQFEAGFASSGLIAWSQAIFQRREVAAARAGCDAVRRSAMSHGRCRTAARCATNPSRSPGCSGSTHRRFASCWIDGSSTGARRNDSTPQNGALTRSAARALANRSDAGLISNTPPSAPGCRWPHRRPRRAGRRSRAAPPGHGGRLARPDPGAPARSARRR